MKITAGFFSLSTCNIHCFSKSERNGCCVSGITKLILFFSCKEIRTRFEVSLVVNLLSYD